MISDTYTASPSSSSTHIPPAADSADVDTRAHEPQDSDDSTNEFDGLPLALYCQQHGISEAELWQMIRTGQIVARTNRGQMFVYGRHCPEPTRSEPSGLEPRMRIDPTALRATEASYDEPPLPFPVPIEQGGPLDLVPVGQISPQSPEVALLLDHLSLAKEENKEILRLSQEAIKRISNMAEQVLAAKESVLAERNELLRSKELLVTAQQEQIELLRQERKNLQVEHQEKKEAELEKLAQEMAKREEEIRRLQQSCEDLQMLADTLSRQDQF